MKLTARKWLLLSLSMVLSNSVLANKTAPQVVAADVFEQTIVQTIESLGTLKASESVEISSTVTERVQSIHFQDGDQVKKSQLLVQLENQEVRANLTELKIATENAKQEYQRYLPLFRRGDVSQSTLDEFKREWDLARAKESVVEARLNKLTLSAPFSGRVGLRLISEGALLTPGTIVTTLQDLALLKLDFSIPSRFLTELNVGDQVVAHTEAFPEQTFTAEIETILSTVDVATRSVQVRAKLSNENDILLPGMLMKVSIQQTPKQALLIPETSIVPVAENHFVYQLIAQPDGLYKVARKQVQIGLRQPGLVEIKSGLNVGDKVVSEGALRVRPGQVVKALTKIERKSEYAIEGDAS